MTENKSPRGVGVPRKSVCLCDFLGVGKVVKACKGFCFLCELGVRFSAVNKERCSGMKGLNEGWNTKCLKQLLCGMESKTASTMIGFWTCRVRIQRDSVYVRCGSGAEA